MAVERVVKVLVAVHQENQDRLVRELQRQGILHITSTEVKESPGVAELDRRLGRLVEAIEQLGPRRKERAGLFGARTAMPREEFEKTASEYDPDRHLGRLSDLNRRLAELGSRQQVIGAERTRLQPWQGLEHELEELYALKSVSVVLGVFADETELAAVSERLAGLAVAIQRVGTGDTEVSVVIVSAPECAGEVNAVLSAARFEPADLRLVKHRPARVLAELDVEERRIEEERQEVQEHLDGLAGEMLKLKVAADALASERARQVASAGLERTRTVSVITGWVRQREFGKLEKLVNRTGLAVLSRFEPEPGEEPPVALSNPRLFRPFELVLELFGLPSPAELDPTVLLAPFFAIFFAFCLTDAGYGIVLGIVAWLLLRKLGRRNKLLGMLFIGGIVTVFAGALVGSWFGDLFDRLGLAPLIRFKNQLMLFDPIQNPMPFFILSLAFGYFHMMYGIVIEIADCLRHRQFGDGLLGQLPWFLGINGLVALVLLGRSMPGWGSSLVLVLILASVAAIVAFTRRSRETMPAQVLWFALLSCVLVFLGARLGALPGELLVARWASVAVFAGMFVHAGYDHLRRRTLRVVPMVLGALGLAGLVMGLARVVPLALGGVLGLPFLFSAPANRALVKKFLWGGYALYGATSYIGIVLSYIRIMALGMVTSGIAMAVNTVAWMVLGIPVLGVVLAIVVLAFGHTYNIAVNVLGAFVHTLRLNYVEFFPRFYTGGGEPFAPLREENRYVAVR